MKNGLIIDCFAGGGGASAGIEMAPLPEPYRETAESHPEVSDRNEITSQDLEAADLEQAIDYFKDELSQIEVFSDIVSFREVERKSIETALKLLQKVQEERKQQVMCDVAQK